MSVCLYLHVRVCICVYTGGGGGGGGGVIGFMCTCVCKCVHVMSREKLHAHTLNGSRDMLYKPPRVQQPPPLVGPISIFGQPCAKFRSLTRLAMHAHSNLNHKYCNWRCASMTSLQTRAHLGFLGLRLPIHALDVFETTASQLSSPWRFQSCKG